VAVVVVVAPQALAVMAVAVMVVSQHLPQEPSILVAVAVVFAL
jgi:hypothetical protein